MSGFLLLLVKDNLAMGAAIVLVSLIRRPLRAEFGAPIALAIWLLVPIASVAVVLPPREVPVPGSVASTLAPAAPAFVTDHAPHLIVAAIEQLVPQSVPTPTAPARPPASSNEMLDLSRALFAIWVLGLLFMASYLTRVQMRFAAAVRRGQAGPAVLGFFRPRIVTPGGFQEQFTPQEQAAILAHERVHLARQDARINAFVALLRCFCWFNPLIHLGARWLRIDQELACDAIAVSREISRRDYSMALLKSQVKVGVLPFGCNWPGPQHPLVERIALLQRKPPGNVRRLAGVSLVLLTITSAGLGAWAAQTPVTVKAVTAEQPSATSATVTPTGAAQGRGAGNPGARQPVAHANLTGSVNDVEVAKNIRARGAVSAAPVAHAQAQGSPNPVTPADADETLQTARTEGAKTVQPEKLIVSQPDLSRPVSTPSLAMSMIASNAISGPTIGSSNQPVVPPPTTNEKAAGVTSAPLNPSTAASTTMDSDKPTIYDCHYHNPVWGRVISPDAIKMTRFGGCSGLDASAAAAIAPPGSCPNEIADPSATLGSFSRRNTSRLSPSLSNCKFDVTLNVRLSDPADGSKMQPGRIVSLAGDVTLKRDRGVTYLTMTNAKVRYADPFGR